jgi:hypothetical protein
MNEKNNKSSEHGLVVSSSRPHALDAAITWHDIEPLRIWVGSRRLVQSGGARVTVSIDFQYLGKIRRDPSAAERKSRLELLNVVQPDSNSQTDLDSIAIRQFPVGRILEEHSKIIGEEVFKMEGPSSQKLNLVSDFVTTSSRRDHKRPKNHEGHELLGNSNSDNILIAFVYARQFAAGATKLSKRTADLLGVDVGVVHVALKIARRNGWITSLGAGKSGGQLTELGELMFQSYDGPRRYEQIVGGR